MNFWKRYPGDYARDTAHLRLAEHGAYTLLLDHAYSTRKPLPASIDELYRLCRASTKLERRAVDSVANQYFPVGQDGLRRNPRAEREIALWEAKAEQNREIGKRGGRPRKNGLENPNGSSLETQTVSARVSETKPTENPLQNPEARLKNPPTPLKGGESGHRNPERERRDESRRAWDAVTTAVDRVKGSDRTWADARTEIGDETAHQVIEQLGGYKLIADRDRYTQAELMRRFREVYQNATDRAECA